MAAPTTHLCRHCGRRLPLDAFYLERARGKPSSMCRACRRARTAAWAKAHPERRRELQRRYRERARRRRHPGEVRTCRDCGRTLPRDEAFRPYTGLRCRECWARRAIAWNRTHPEQARRNGRESARRRYADPAKRATMLLQWRLSHLRRRTAARKALAWSADGRPDRAVDVRTKEAAVGRTNAAR